MRYFTYYSGKRVSSETLAKRLRDAKELVAGQFFNLDPGKRRLWDVLEDRRLDPDGRIYMETFIVQSTNDLLRAGFSFTGGDNFKGTPEELCTHFADMMDKL